MKNVIKISMILLLTMYLATACKKKTDLSKVNYSKLAAETNDAQKYYDDLFKVIDEEAKNGDYHSDVNGKTTIVRSAVSDTCALVTLDISGGFPMTLTIDFGAGCTGTNTSTGASVTRKGKITCVFTGLYSQAGSSITVTLDDYYVNDYHLEGTKVITNEGRNAANNLTFSVKVNNGLVTKPNGDQFTWKTERMNEWIAGEGTNVFTDGYNGICDDSYLVTGYAEGTTSDDVDFRIDITSPLRKDICCRWVTGGVISYAIEGTQVATVDYTNTTCVNPTATLDYGGKEYVFVIQ